MEISGKLIQKLPLQSGVGKTGTSWQKQEFVIETIETYPKKICANLWGDKADILQSINIGDQVVMSFHVESREYNGKWYTDVKAWKLETAVAAPQVAPQQMSSTPTYPTANELPSEFEGTFVDEGQDDLPF
ncbi:MAG: hypothetical protein CVU02_02790 [Bacteroidetes bacterium HGW-Bacteroidetes-19]|nr:MAG: hypothetical protein CVU02_02790 [Bacteroidetes bacterium HGW-Bacteroidetes-19]